MRSGATVIGFMLLAFADIPVTHADDWVITPSVELEEVFSDNIDLEPNKTKSDLISIVRPGVSIAGDGPRFNLNLDYSVEGRIFLDNTDESDVRQHLTANTQVDLVPGTLFLDAQAAIEETPVSTGAPVSQSGITGNDNLANVYSVNISPFVKHAFGSSATLEARYRFNLVAASKGELDSAVTNQFTSTLASGEDFKKLVWDVTTNAEFTEGSSNDPSSNRQLAQIDLQYVVDPRFSLLGGVGYERIRDDTLIDEPEGPIGYGGFLATPGPRTSLRLTYGWRFDRPNWSFDGSYLISPEISVLASYSESLETSGR